MLKCLACHGFLEFGKATGQAKFSYNPLRWGVPIPWEIDAIVQRMKARKEEAALRKHQSKKKLMEKKKKSNKKPAENTTDHMVEEGDTMDYGIPNDPNQEEILGEVRKMPALSLVEENIRKRTRMEAHQEGNLIQGKKRPAAWLVPTKEEAKKVTKFQKSLRTIFKRYKVDLAEHDHAVDPKNWVPLVDKIRRHNPARCTRVLGSLEDVHPLMDVEDDKYGLELLGVAEGMVGRPPKVERIDNQPFDGLDEARWAKVRAFEEKLPTLYRQTEAKNNKFWSAVTAKSSEHGGSLHSHKDPVYLATFHPSEIATQAAQAIPRKLLPGRTFQYKNDRQDHLLGKRNAAAKI
jgi:hypothetical protein